MAGKRSVHFSEEQMQEIERLALLNCNSNTISEAVGVAGNTLRRHCGKKLRHWRAIYRVNLRASQDSLSKTSADMCKFLGTNVLDQQVKQVIKTEQAKSDIPEAQRPAYKEAARVLKIRLAETGT